MNRIVDGVDGVDGIDGLRIGIHVCRGNWSRQEEVLLSGDYTALVPAFDRMRIAQTVLEYSTPRAGEIEIIGRVLGPAGKEIGLGVVNPRTDEIESVEQIVERVEEALKYYAPSAVFLNPDCGFGTFATRCVANEETAVRKMRRIVEAAHVMRDKYALN